MFDSKVTKSTCILVKLRLYFVLQQRLDATGTDGARVQEFVRNIPQTTPHVQNDFSNLGIPAPGDNNWDNVSVTSVSATAVPYTQVGHVIYVSYKSRVMATCIYVYMFLSVVYMQCM